MHKKIPDSYLKREGATPGILVSRLNNTMQKSIDTLTNQIATLTKSVSTLSLKIDSMDTDLKSVKASLQEIPKIKADLVNVKTTIDGLETAQDFTDEQITNLKSDITNLVSTQADIKEDLDKRFSKCSDKIKEGLENVVKETPDERKRNLLFLGVSEKINIDIRYIICDIVSNTQIKLDPKEIDNAVRVGPFRGSDKPRPIQVSFVSTYTRNAVYQRRNNLKQNPHCLGLRIVEDLPESIQADRHTLRVVAEQAIRAGHSVKLHSDNLYIDGTRYTAKSLDLLPDDSSLENSFIIMTPLGLAFCSEHAYLSNFHKCPFSYNGTDYSCSEQAIQGTKARTSNDPTAEKLIMQAKEPLVMKRIGDKVIPSEHWLKHCPEYISNILRAKYSQNPELARKLVATGNTPLIEATQSSY